MGGGRNGQSWAAFSDIYVEILTNFRVVHHDGVTSNGVLADGRPSRSRWPGPVGIGDGWQADHWEAQLTGE